MHAIARDSLREESPRTSPANPDRPEPGSPQRQSPVGRLAGGPQMSAD